MRGYLRIADSTNAEIVIRLALFIDRIETVHWRTSERRRGRRLGGRRRRLSRGRRSRLYESKARLGKIIDGGLKLSVWINELLTRTRRAALQCQRIEYRGSGTGLNKWINFVRQSYLLFAFIVLPEDKECHRCRNNSSIGIGRSSGRDHRRAGRQTALMWWELQSWWSL